MADDDFGGMIGIPCDHKADGDDATWRYIADCGCYLCEVWELWVTGWDHPPQIDEEEWWQYVTLEGAGR